MRTTRCDILHEKSEDGLTFKESRQLREDIKEKYLLRPAGLPPGYAYLLEQPLELTLKLSDITKKKWLISARISRKEAAT